MSVKIHGRDYATVAERVTAAHAAGGYALLSSKVLPLGDTGRLYCQVEIRVGDCRYVGSSELKLNAKPGTPDGDSPLECAETSALGRALGFAGFGSADSIASADELRRVS